MDQGNANAFQTQIFSQASDLSKESNKEFSRETSHIFYIIRNYEWYQLAVTQLSVNNLK